jgi:multiple sugar transport system substrate-binding protein
VLYYRADLFAEASVPPPSTHEAFLTAAQAFSRAPERYGFGQRGSRVGHRWWGDFTRAQGLRFDGEGGSFALNSEQSVAANQWFIDLYARHRVTPPSSITDSWGQHLAQLISGEVAMVAHTTHLAPLLEAALGDRISVVPMPVGPHGRFSTFYPQNHAIYRGAKQKEAAWVFISWLAEADQVLRWCRNPHRWMLPNVKSLMQDPLYRDNRFYRASLDSMSSWIADPWFHPRFGEFVERVWPRTWQRALRGDITSRQMMDSLQAHFEGRPAARG